MTPKTIDDFTQELKAQYPTLSKSINNETVALSSKEYEITIAEWANNQLANQAKAAAVEQAATDKASATAKFEALGLTANDLKALGL